MDVITVPTDRPDLNKVVTTAREAVHNFSYFADLAQAGVEVTITRRGLAPLKLVRAEIQSELPNRAELAKKALSFRALRPYPGKFNRADAYE
jgi:antitoxin (DNA-binding transcriptional repressor) of toxin-antitoxin stability system